MALKLSWAADRLLAAIVASSDDAIVSKDLAGVILSWNGAAERMFGFTAAEAIGRSIALIIPNDRRAEEARVLESIRAGVGISHLETLRQRKDGTLVEVSLTVSPIRDDSGAVVGASKIARDITDARRLARELDEASRLKDEFLATLSHELRTPINAIAGYAQMLRKHTLDPAKAERALEVIERNTAALGTMVGDLLDLSRIVTGNLRMDVEPIDVVRVVKEAIETVQPAIEAKRQQLVREFAADAGAVRGDPQRLQQVVWNLLTNAAKFTPPSGRIVVRVARAGDAVEIVVADSGIGMDPAFVPHVFERFRQADGRSTREFSGLGVGLALVRHFVELHGGTVEAQSEGRGRGATFRVLLPRLPD